MIKTCCKSILLATIPVVATQNAGAQTDTLVTRLREVSVVGVKQTPLTDMSATTTIGQAETQRLGIVAMKDVSELVPNFYMPGYGSRMTSSIYVRGLGARMDQPVVGLNVDGVPVLNKDAYDFDLFDISKIEVLRGSQAILNGRNTMAGQINITTLSPWQWRGVRFMAEYGRANSAKAGAAYYFGITDRLASSVSAYVTTTDGYYTNSHNGAQLGSEKAGSLRWKLSWHPSDNLSLTNAASATATRQGGYPYAGLATGEISYNDTCHYRRATIADALTVGFTGRRTTVTSVTAFQYLDDNMVVDQDFTPQSYFTLMQKRKEWALTEDIYTKHARGPLTWLGGAFGFARHTSMSAPVTFKDDGIANLIEKHPNEMNPYYPIEWSERSFVLGSEFTPVNFGGSVYAQAQYLLGRWRFEAGVRLDIERARLSYYSHCDTGYDVYKRLPDGDRELYYHQPVKIDDHGHLSRTYTEFLPKIAIGYQAAEATTLFLNVSKGYKAGGFNVQMFSDVLEQRIMEMMGMTKLYDIDDIVSYKPEKSWNAELGVKSDIGKVNAEGVLFYISCTDQQLTMFPPGLTTGRIMTNAGRTRSWGAELSLAWMPADCITLRGSYGYTNARFAEYDDGRADHSGHRLPYAPSNTLFLSANYIMPIVCHGVTPSLSADMRGVGDIYWNEANTERQPFYATLGLALALSHERWNLRLWGENVTSTRYDNFYFLSMGNAFVQRGNPMTWGATLRLNI